MVQSNSAGGEEDPEFRWGAMKAIGRKNKSVRFYESFTYEGIQYRLFDSACFLIHGRCETSIGKLVRMFETSTGEKKIKVIWFFRPIEIYKFLGEYEPHLNELFLACGDDPGVCNINDVESIIGKCNVVCMSNDRRNPQPERREIRTANYVFSRNFDTRLKIISEDFADAIAGIKVENLFNKKRDKQPLKSNAAASSRESPVKSFHPQSESTKLERNGSRDGKLMSRTSPEKKDLFLKDRVGQVHVKKNPPVNTDTMTRDLKTKTRALGNSLASGSAVDPRPPKMRKLILNTPETDDSDDSGPQSREKRVVKNPPLVDKAPRQKIDKSSWYKKLPFEEELKEAIEKDRLILIENLEPSCTSREVEELCRQAFNEQADAKMIPASRLSNPHNGRALVIFETTKAADNALSRLSEGCLMLCDGTDQRPLVGSRNVPKEVGECKSFTGHFSLIDKASMSIQKRKAVSTSHCAQPNHIVHHMALEWYALQAKSELQWKTLFEEQAKDINIRSKKNIFN